MGWGGRRGGRNQDGHSALVISFKHINVEII